MDDSGVACVGSDPGAVAGIAVYADAEKLVQILVNILANAVKFSRPG